MYSGTDTAIKDLCMLPTHWINQQGLSVYILLAACILLSPWSAASMEHFGLEREALAEHQYWRFWTGHFVHLSWSHLLLNAAGLVLLQQLFGNELQESRWLSGTALIALFMSLCWFFSGVESWLGVPIYDFVVGMSGLLHGLFAFAACLAIRNDPVLGVGVLLALTFKSAAEIFAGPSDAVVKLIDMPIAVDMHLYGIVGGMVVGVFMILLTRRHSV
jgi:rhomboid family GlyGly-CTERM serine protease